MIKNTKQNKKCTKTMNTSCPRSQLPDHWTTLPGNRSSRPKSCRPETESCCPKFIVMSPKILSHVDRHGSRFGRLDRYSAAIHWMSQLRKPKRSMEILPTRVSASPCDPRNTRATNFINLLRRIKKILKT